MSVIKRCSDKLVCVNFEISGSPHSWELFGAASTPDRFKLMIDEITRCYIAPVYQPLQETIVIFISKRVSLKCLSTARLTKCEHQLHLITGYSSIALPGSFVPNCRIDNGHYETVQCETSGATCFCVQSVDGYELSGSRMVGHPDCDKFGRNILIRFSSILKQLLWSCRTLVSSLCIRMILTSLRILLALTSERQLRKTVNL